MAELCRDLAKPILGGPDREPGTENIDPTTNIDQCSADTPATHTAATRPSIPPLHVLTDALPIVPANTAEVHVKIEDVPLVLRSASAKSEAADCENPSIPNSLRSETVPKVEELSQPGPSSLPLQPWECVVLARDEEHASIEDLLDCLAVEELQPLVKSFKVKCVSKKVNQSSLRVVLRCR